MKYECLSDLIGIITDCEKIPGTSAYCVNNIPGIDLPTADGLANNREYKTGLDLIKSTLAFACDLTGEEILRGIDGSSFAFNAILNQGSYCFLKPTFMAAYPGQRGVRINKRHENNYSSLLITTIRVCIEADAVLTFTITEATGKVTTFTTSTTVKGKVPTDILLNYECLSRYVDITIDNTILQVADTGCWNIAGGCLSCAAATNQSTASNVDNYVHVNGLQDGIPQDGQTFGMIPFVQVICNSAKLLCQLKSYIDLACLYKFAGQFFQQAAMSKENNRYTTYTREEAAEKALYYDNPTRGFQDGKTIPFGLFQVEIESVKRSLTKFFGTQNNICFVCTDNHFTYARP